MNLRPSARALALGLGTVTGKTIKHLPSGRLAVTALAAGAALSGGASATEGSRLLNKKVVITGAAGGIGQATRKALRREGARVEGIDLSPEKGMISGDVTDARSIEAAIEEAAERLGGMDIIINNAGIGRAQDAGDFPDEGSRKTLEINLLGSWNTAAAAIPHLVKTGGHVVNVSSGLALLNVPYAAAYSASKRGLAAYSDALRLEYDGRLTVSTVYPGYMKTPIHDVVETQGASLDGLVPEEPVEYASEAIIRACKTKKRDVFTSAQALVALSFARHFPGPTDAIVRRRFKKMRGQRSRPDFLRDPQAESRNGSARGAATQTTQHR